MKLPAVKFPPNSDDIFFCCGHATYVDRMKVDMRSLSNPPRITAQEIMISHWQCHVREDHFGDVWDGIYPNNVKHENIFETEVNELELGNENQQRN